MSLPVQQSNLAYQCRGSGVPVVLLHGLTFDRSAWRSITDRLADDVQCITVDLPGHGDTPGPPCGLKEVASRLHCLLGELGVERPILVGHSMSAVIAMIYAASYPVRGVVDIDQPIDARPFAQLLRQIEPQLRGDHFAAAFAPFQHSMGLDLVADPIHTEVLARQRVSQELVLGYWDEVLRAGPAQMHARIEQIARRIDAPALYIFGRQLSPDEGDYLLAHIPHAELEIWPGRGHFVHLAEPDRFTARLHTFIEKCAREASPLNSTGTGEQSRSSAI
jgi:pimeloyl-ACP methyl ester carboxylesterase